MKLLKRIIIIVMTGLTVVFLLLYEATYLSGPGYSRSYQSVIQRKYEKLTKTESPKVILVGGSNLAFGIDENLLENILERSVVNLGLHAGMGHLFNTELSKANINEGDLVVLIYEYGWLNENAFDNFDANLVMSGIDNKKEMYKIIPKSKYPALLDNYLDYRISKHRNKSKQYNGIYSSASFDKQGNMVANRPKSIITKKNKTLINITDKQITSETQRYLTEFKNYVEGKGAKVVFSYPSVLDTQIQSREYLKTIPYQVNEKLGIDSLSSPEDYLFKEDYIYDTIYHLNSDGAVLRTEKLAKDILKYMNKNK